MSRRLLVSGDREAFTTLEFDATEKRLRVLADYPAPYNASWVELVGSRGDRDFLLGLSEGDESGLVYSFEIDHANREFKITSQLATLAAPGHVRLLRDRCAVALGNYLGASVALYPSSVSAATGCVLENAPGSEIFPDFPYASMGHGPNLGRQKQCHPHQVLEDGRGFLYVPDLGSDRVWVLQRANLAINVCGWLQCPPGTGPRHAVMNHDETMMYMIGELSHTVLAFDLSNTPDGVVQPIKGFEPNIIPLTVPAHHQFMMDSSEICIHPKISNVLYVSNRWQRHIAQREPQLQDVPVELPPGDTVAIILLSQDGKAVMDIRYIETQADVIRGMQISDDGRYAVVAGQEGGGLEIYEISGYRGETWTLEARLSEGLGNGLKHAAWL